MGGKNEVHVCGAPARVRYRHRPLRNGHVLLPTHLRSPHRFKGRSFPTYLPRGPSLYQRFRTFMMQCWCATANVAYDRHGVAICDAPCSGDSSITCGGTFAFEIYPFPSTAAPTPAPGIVASTPTPVALPPTPTLPTPATTLAPTPATVAITGEAIISAEDLANAVENGGDLVLTVVESETKEVIGNVVTTVTPEARRQLGETFDGPYGLRGSSRGLQGVLGVSTPSDASSYSEE